MNEATLTFKEGTKDIKNVKDMITEVIIPEGVTEISDFAFKDCSSLKIIAIPSSITKIGKCAFYSCSSLTSITIPSSISRIGWCAFNNCSSLESIYIDKEKDSLDLSKTSIPNNTKIYWKNEF